MRSLTIVVAMLSMAAGAWQGTTAQSESPRSATAAERPADTTQLRLRGCVQRGDTASTYLLVAPASAVTEAGRDPASSHNRDDGGAALSQRSPVRVTALKAVGGPCT